jgi:CRISP-associated protein Cas1
MIKVGDEPLDPANALGEPPRYPFDFRTRNRRPPRDPVNALLSLAYTLVAKDFTVTAAAVGFDPYLGFYHASPAGPTGAGPGPDGALPAAARRLGRHHRHQQPDGLPRAFRPGRRGVTMTQSGRKAFIRAYEQRMDQLVTHPLFDYRVSYRRYWRSKPDC